MDSLAAVNWQTYEQEAQRLVGAAHSADELEEVRVRYLGRKSELAQALRGVRDRERGMLLNGIRARLEAAVGERESELTRRAYEAATRLKGPRRPGD